MRNFLSVFPFCFLVETSFGPMSRDVDGLVQGMRALWDGYMFDLDPSVVPMTFNEEVSTFIGGGDESIMGWVHV